MALLGIFVFGFLLLRFIIVSINYLAPQKLTSQNAKHRELVSILIPARDEEQNITQVLASVSKLAYKNYEVLVLDDQSSDNTATLVQEFAEKNKRVRLIEGKPLPEGWLGKNWACHQLAQEAKGDFFLFIDADIALDPEALRNALSYIKEHQLSLLSVFPDQEMGSVGEKLIVPIMHYLLLSLLPLVLIRKSAHPSLAAANGQFMLFNAKDYKQHWFHKSLRTAITEDIEIMKYIKEQELKGQALLANGFVSCRMYHSYEDGLEGFSKNILSGFGNSKPLLLTYLFLIFLSYPLLYFFMDTNFLLVSFALIVYMRVMIAIISRQPIWDSVMLHVPQMFNLLQVALLSIQKSMKKTNTWKGRSLDIK